MIRTVVLTLSFVLALLGCGVKGDPVPPEKAPELGRGRPNFKKATEGIRPEAVGLAPSGRTYRDDEKAEEEEEKRNSSIEETK